MKQKKFKKKAIHRERNSTRNDIKEHGLMLLCCSTKKSAVLPKKKKRVFCWSLVTLNTRLYQTRTWSLSNAHHPKQYNPIPIYISLYCTQFQSAVEVQICNGPTFSRAFSMPFMAKPCWTLNKRLHPTRNPSFQY